MFQKKKAVDGTPQTNYLLHEKLLSFIRRDNERQRKTDNPQSSPTQHTQTDRGSPTHTGKLLTQKRSATSSNKADGSPEMKTANAVDPNDNIGFPAVLPPNSTEQLVIEAKFDNLEMKAGIVLSKSMLVLRVEDCSIFSGKMQICDFLTKIDDFALLCKREFYEYLKQYRKSGKKFKIRLERPLWNTPATRLPKGYDRVPGYSYIRGLMILYPGGNLGMSVKSYNNKVFVTNTEQMSMASAACLMGDCIIDVDGVPVTTTSTCGDRIIMGLKEKKYILMTIERAVDPQALRVVKYILLVEKTPEKDPRMARDTTKIGLNEADKIRRNLVMTPLKSIYRGRHNPNAKHLSVREMSMFTPIGADPFNPLLMQAVPPKRMDAMHAAKAASSDTKIKDRALADPFPSTSSSTSSNK